MDKGWWSRLGKADTALSLGEWIVKVSTLVGISTSGITAWLLSKADPFISEKGPLYWYAIAIITSLTMAVTVWLIFASMAKQALAKYYASLAIPKSCVNPLDKVFTDKIISIEDLRLPGQQLHERKHFSGCTFVGPGAVGIIGGTYSGCGFSDYGDIVSLPDQTTVVGLVILKDCHVDNCQFIRMSIFCDKNTARAFDNTGARVKGVLG